VTSQDTGTKTDFLKYDGEATRSQFEVAGKGEKPTLLSGDPHFTSHISINSQNIKK
jgi:hypothetical protein